MSTYKPILFSLLITFIFGSLILAMPSTAQEEPGELTGDTYLLRFAPQAGDIYTYSLSSSGMRGDRIAVATENYTVTIGTLSDGKFAIIGEGEDVPEGAALGYRFQRAYYPQFLYTIDQMGQTEIPYGQPFPPFINVPLFPEAEVSVGSTWSGGPVGILPDKNVGNIPFTYESTLTSIASFRGENCAVIDTTYEAALSEPIQSFHPFLGLVEGDEPEEPGLGALIGGVIEGSRAEEAGIEPGDLVIGAEGERIRGWGGLEEILPLIVPEKELELTLKRGEEEINVVIVPEGVPVADVTAAGTMTSTCFFSLDRGIPLKVDLTSVDLVFTIKTNEDESEERPAEFHYIWEYQYSGT